MSGFSSQSGNPCTMAEDAKGVEYLRSPVSDSRSLGLRNWCIWMTDSCRIREGSKVMESVDLRATGMVWRGSIKNPFESLGNIYEPGPNSSRSKERNLVAREGASTSTGTGVGGRLPTSVCSHSMGSRPLWIIGRMVPPAATIAM